MATIRQMLQEMTKRNGTDLHIAEGAPALVRVDGELVPIGKGNFTAAQAKNLAYSVLTEAQRFQLERDLQIDFSFAVKGMARFRGSVYHQQGSVASAFRMIPMQVASLSKLGLPSRVEWLCQRPRGLILVTGPTGSGKSTTLAAMIDEINRTRHGHIITVEEPIEFVHPNRSCLVNQREVPTDAHSFSLALRAALRADPDVVMVGEMRDLETIETALRIAETGHLTLATLHTISASASINRIIDAFPAHQQAQVRVQLAMVLEGILCQALLPRASGKGRALAVELLVMTTAVRNLIRDNKLHQVYNAMQSGTGRSGMQTFNRSLCDLVERRRISKETALAHSSKVDELKNMMSRSGRIG